MAFLAPSRALASSRSLPLIASLVVGVAGLSGCCSATPEALASVDAEERREALACLGEDALEDPERRADALREARRRVDPEVEPSAAVRATALRVLGALHRAGPPLEDLPTTAGGRLDAQEHERVRLEAARELGAVPESEVAGDLLRRVLREDPSADVRLTAARELGQRADPPVDTTWALIEALRDVDPSTRLVAHRSLHQLHGVDNGLDARRWRDWFEQRLEQAPSDRPPRELPAPTPLDGPGEEAPALEEEPRPFRPLPAPTPLDGEEAAPLPPPEAFPEESFPEEEYAPPEEADAPTDEGEGEGQPEGEAEAPR